MRLIDADALLDAMRDEEFQTFVPLDEIDSVIDKAPTIDAVPVVRCVECIHHERTKRKLGFSWCGKFGNIMRYADFCSCGEKRSGGEKG